MNGAPVSIYNAYMDTVRVLSPKWQYMNFASLFTETDWDTDDAFIVESRIGIPRVDK